MSGHEPKYRPEPKRAQIRRLRLKHGLSEPGARLIAWHLYGGIGRG
jgi:hypothetical protein